MKRTGWALFLAVIALSVLAGAAKVHADLQGAAVAFGRPAAGLSLWQRWRLSTALLRAHEALFTPLPATAGATLVVSPGETATAIAHRLQQQGLVPDAAAFLAYLRYKGWDTDLQAGKFHFTHPMSPVALAKALRHRPPTEAVVVILPGWRREEVAAALPSSGLALPPARFLQATSHAEGYPLPFTVPAGASLEGFLAPGRYTLPRDADAQAVIAPMLAQAAASMSPAWQKAVRAHGLSPYQGLILASIVQRETHYSEEMPHIAAVYLNRLRRGMALEADPTVQYALGKAGVWWPSPLNAADLHTPSPYNTYLHPGLPPAPIANPSSAALHAVAAAPPTDDLFFRAACDGSGRHVFSRTFQEHLGHACP